MRIFQSAHRLVLSNGSINFVRAASSQAQVFGSVTDDAATEARPYKEIPRPSKFEFVRAFLPGGEFHGVSIVDYSTTMRNRYGDLFIMPGMFGRQDLIASFSTKDIEMVFRNEGAWPQRDVFPSITYYRTHIRKDFYEGNLGIVNSQAEAWSKLRTALNPIFMQPKGLKVYYEPLSNINDLFIER
ncbi:probable cytochrome P450 12d1 proximal, mitochondrial [Drosophila takahashii]|uniref:probable cytochrome P450 12d1 proximal, mitochondrial n=1 Tax=Drosophila takahashii TaxID=29030 RepID=UPI003899447B